MENAYVVELCVRSHLPNIGPIAVYISGYGDADADIQY